MRVALAVPDEAMARTEYHARFLEALRAQAAFTADDELATLLFPAEDTALETNWPRYGNQASAFIRGSHDEDRYRGYLGRLAALKKPVCIVNMHAFVRVPRLFAHVPNVFVADGSLATWERALNPRTISMPALPIVATDGAPFEKTILASFRGVLSHPCRAALREIHDGKDIICEIVPPELHAGTLDATQNRTDASYAGLMAKSVFAFVPRGDALFSYRLLEALAHGCIPIVLSDGWILPFDRTLDWSGIALTVPESFIPQLPKLLRKFPATRIGELQRAARETYARHFASLDHIVATLLGELAPLVAA